MITSLKTTYAKLVEGTVADPSRYSNINSSLKVDFNGVESQKFKYSIPKL